ncbi:MAG: ATP-grasp domain-containing protein [Bacteroidales bacterium]|nr:ATP-grasp domain-containing protein [Bacteroidales bacterium]
MIIGLTYDLRSAYLAMGYTEEETAEFDRESTIEALEGTLQELGFQTRRIGHLKQLIERLQQGDRWDMVFNICEGMYGISREAQVPVLLDAYRIPYVFSSALVMALTLDKAMTKRIIRDAGLYTPEFCVVEKPSDIALVSLPYPLFAKPLAEGTGKGINEMSVIRNKSELHKRCLQLLNEYKQPVLVETFLSGREFTTGIVGSGENATAIGTIEIKLQAQADMNVYSYTNKEECETHVEYLPVGGKEKEECEKLALEAYKVLGCADAGRVDIRYDSQGNAAFIEINPLPGMHPEHSDLPILARLNGIPYQSLMKMIMDSAIARTKDHQQTK